ncbi:rhodanese-like domain-containing protein [Caviibacter abscessus]|uniref:rhodanese-like domain-containing protein n=1 Tax=Caviibacter abscessus TaxID=1766719 RepID=UPI0009EA259F|nr:rhodanese-like domain-containing protein [Caviibacter abscessus]
MFDFLKPVPSIKIEQLKEDMVLIDVRKEEEYKEGHIKGSKNIPLDKIESFCGDKNKKVYVICRSGRRSKIATKYLNKKGYDAYNVLGGMLEWEMLKVNFYDNVEDSLLKFAVIITKFNDEFVFCKHKKRDTLEIPGGHREFGEDILTTAKRELYEETGAIKYTITPISIYSVTVKGVETFGMLYFADVKLFEKELHSEIEKIVFLKNLPKNLTYPEIQPKLISIAKQKGFIK